MSAILAIVNLDGTPIVRDAFCDAFEILAPYGGDGSDTWIEKSVALGQHLLHLTPESRYEKQPYHWDEAVIVADARLDNRDELCSRFDLSQTEAAVTPDSHLILQAYRLWGEDCPAHLLGDFAFAIWDRRNRRLLCARDHIGVRPLYYYQGPATLVVATDIRALLALPYIPCEIDEYEVATFLVDPRAIKQKTFFKSVQILRAGHQIIASDLGMIHRAHWLPHAAPDVRYKSITEYAAEFRYLLESAVCARMRTPYPVGAHLSGGLDSSGVAVLANQLLREQSRSLDMIYTWSPEKSDAYPSIQGDERNTIEMLCRQEGFPCNYGTTMPGDYRDFLARDIAVELATDIFEEFPVMAHAGALGIRTILTGWGGDEAATYAGRNYLSYLLKQGRLRELARITRRHAGLGNPRRTARYLFRYAITPLLPNALYNRVDPYYRADRQESYIHPSFAARFPQATKSRTSSLREIADPREMQIRLLQSGHLGERMASWAAWSSTHRLVHTYPLTDRRVLEFVLGLPPELLYQQGTTRYLFREALKDILPPLPPKNDPVNARKRLDHLLACWHMLANEVRAGQWSKYNVPWLDLDKLRAKLLAVPDEMTPEHLREFAAFSSAVRIWHLWQRYGERNGDSH